LIEVRREEVLIESPKEVPTPERGPDRDPEKVTREVLIEIPKKVTREVLIEISIEVPRDEVLIESPKEVPNPERGPDRDIDSSLRKRRS